MGANLKQAFALFRSAVSVASGYAGEVNIVCNWTNFLSDRPQNAGATRSSFAAIIDDKNKSITISDYCPHGVSDAFDEHRIVVACTDDLIKRTYNFDRISGSVASLMTAGEGGFLVHYGECYATQKRF
jgi:hypothetical protein